MPLEHHHLGAVDRTVGRLAAGKARLPDQRGIAGGVDEAVRRELRHRRTVSRDRSSRMQPAVERDPRRTAPSSTGDAEPSRTVARSNATSATSSYITTIVVERSAAR